MVKLRHDHPKELDRLVRPVEMNIPPGINTNVNDVGEVFRKRYATMMEMSDGGMRIDVRKDGESEPAWQAITILDMFGLPETAETLPFVRRRLGIDTFTEPDFERLNTCVAAAKRYLLKYLHIDMPGDLKQMKDFKNEADVDQFFGYLKKPTTKGAYHCTLAKVTLAYWEHQNHELRELVEKTKFLYDTELQTDPDAGDRRRAVADARDIKRCVKIRTFTERDGSALKGKDHMSVVVDERGLESIDAYASWRGKDEFRTITKLLAKPEVDIDRIVTDGVGLRFEVDSIEDGVKLATFLKGFLFHADGTDVNLSDHGFLSGPLELQDMEIQSLRSGVVQQISEVFAGCGIKSFGRAYKTLATMFKGTEVRVVEKKNAASDEDFVFLGVRGQMELPKEPTNPQSMTTKTSVEVQIFLKGKADECEQGYARHEVYEGKQKLAVASRLFGTFSEAYLQRICEEVAEQTAKDKSHGLITDALKAHFLDHGFITPVKVRGEPQRKNRYVWTAHIDRWQKTGIWPSCLTYKGKPS